MIIIVMCLCVWSVVSLHEHYRSLSLNSHQWKSKLGVSMREDGCSKRFPALNVVVMATGSRVSFLSGLAMLANQAITVQTLLDAFPDELNMLTGDHVTCRRLDIEGVASLHSYET